MQGNVSVAEHCSVPQALQLSVKGRPDQKEPLILSNSDEIVNILKDFAFGQ